MHMYTKFFAVVELELNRASVASDALAANLTAYAFAKGVKQI